MRLQVGEYIQFVKSFSETVNIMTKTFFIVIPYSPSVLGKAGGDFLSRFTGGKKKTEKEGRLESFEENRTQLEQRASVVEQGLGSTGIRVARLGTEELIELFFKMFNPGEVEKPIPGERVGKE